jgi:K+-transporting ATPase KdpF subunit
MSIDLVLGLGTATLLGAYLFYVLVRPERF